MEPTSNLNNHLNQPIKELVLPKPHILSRLIRANETYMLAARGTFKTSRGISLYMIDMVYEMPGSTGVAVGLSFEQLGDNTFPPLLQALDEFGFHHGEHYVIGRRPPKEWPKSYLGVINDKYDHVMSWHNGTIIYLVSLAKKASANGISAQWGFFDEAKFMNYQELVDEIYPIFRGNEETKRRFSSCSGYLSKFFATDKKADPAHIKWLLDKRKEVNQEVVDIVLSLAIKLNELKLKFEKVGRDGKWKLKKQIQEYEEKLSKLRSSLVYVAEVNAYDVVYAHGEKWLKDKKRNTREYDFKITYENEDPDRPGESFYPDFDIDRHTYVDQFDIDPGKPLIISVDYQHSIAPICIAQVNKIKGNDMQSLNYVDEVYKLEPEGLKEAIEEFCTRYQSHINKTVYYVFDHTAKGRRQSADTYFELVENYLKTFRWKVIRIYTGMAPDHFVKYDDTRRWLTSNSSEIRIFLNRERCPKTIMSITGAGAYIKSGKTQKNKLGETEEHLDQSETTHFSDAFDMLNHAVLKLRLISTRVSSQRIVIR